jgi:hypothetical protein
MPYQLNFSRKQKYKSSEQGITLEVVVRHGELYTHCPAKVDTGAQVCLFAREIGETVGLKIEEGLRREFSTLVGNFVAYGHEVTFEMMESEIHSIVYFAAEEGFKRNLLGREGWLQLLRLAIIDYDEELYLSSYNEQI